MAARSVLWADLRISSGPSDLCNSLPKSYRAQRVTTIGDVFKAIQSWLPWAVCFEYDGPDAHGLEALVETRRRFPSLPVVMVTGRHSEALAAWSLRCCVWDYLVKPLTMRRLCTCLTSIDRAVPPVSANRPATIAPVGALAIEVSGLTRQLQVGSALRPALSYVEANYSGKLRMATAARLCDLSPFQFSRSFKKENGFTFRDFVVRVRIQRAAELIKQSKVSVTEAAFGVGFNDLSYFARMFRRQVGLSPSHYRTQRDPEQMWLFPPTDFPRP